MAVLRRAAGVAAALSAIATATPVPALYSRQSNGDLSSCPGYSASNIQTSSTGMTADLSLAGDACNVYGDDIQDLTLTVEYQTDSRLHVLIQDANNQVYQVPSDVVYRPDGNSDHCKESESDLKFNYVENPFSFSVVRKSNDEVLFDTSAASFVFESQYFRLRTSLPSSPSLYGLGEHTDPFMLNTTNYTRTFWNRDAYSIPTGTNLYGDHPVYFDHRAANGTHGVFLLNSDGMDVKIDDADGQYLEYNAIGGVVDLYFMAGPGPVDVAQQYSEVVGKSAMMPYWGFGFHQCRYGYRDVYEVAEVVANYSSAGIPLETMWTDIDYMYLRRVFTLDPYRYPLDVMQELVSTLHDRQQHYIVMVDPAVAYNNNDAYFEGVEQDVFLKRDNGTLYKGVVWPGVTVFPDWFDPSTQDYWNGQFGSFFDADTGVNIDALWIDMNEAANFCNYPCANPEAEAEAMGNPPRPPPVRLGSPRQIPGFPQDFQPVCKSEVTFRVNASTFYGENIVLIGSALTLGEFDESNAVSMSADNYPVWSVTVDMPANGDFTYQFLRAEPDGSYIYEDNNRTVSTGDCSSTDETDVQSITTSSPDGSSKLKRSASSIPPQGADLAKRQSSGDQKGLPDRDLINPPYMIDNAAGSLSNKTIDTSLTHYGGWKEYDTHNLYGAMMSETSRIAMLSRRPSLRPMVITRSTFAGSGRQVGHWLGDNISDWFHYLVSISQMLDFGALFQVPMVGSDVCGFGGNTNELLCARWATLGAFYPFYRNHNELGSLSQEFYRWPLVAEAARNAINIRYQLLDYFYTSFYEQTVSGTPAVQPMFFAYPEDENTFPLGYQFFWGPGIMVAPVTEENSTSTTVYMPDDIFYDYYTHEAVRGQGEEVTLTDIDYTTIPLYYKGGSIVAQRSNSSNTTTELRKQDFTVVIAPGLDGTAKGSLYLDDGVSLEQGATSYIHFHYSANGEFRMEGTFGYDSGNAITGVMVLGSGDDNGHDDAAGGAPGHSGGHRKDGGHGQGSMGWHGRGSQKSMQIPLTGPKKFHV
ncbi:alpha-glucosidase [Hortaea werneckii]|uniref:CBM20 domain-containing protein n=2 Tax=Hortaea werneckii TaxID=91943 RepID=A0A3M7BL00_HORWE|nr:alpha-glucosidase [Hortaea werneckii]RMY40207.1 hypothetical protein D0866_01417 [Hortaea werneckii]